MNMKIVAVDAPGRPLPELQAPNPEHRAVEDHRHQPLPLRAGQGHPEASQHRAEHRLPLLQVAADAELVGRPPLQVDDLVAIRPGGGGVQEFRGSLGTSSGVS